MTHDKEYNDLIELIAEKSLKIIADIQKNPSHLSSLLEQYISLTEHFHSITSTFLNNPEKIWEMQFTYWKDAMCLAQHQFEHWLKGETMPIQDSRFDDDSWLRNPFFNLLSQHYLLASQHMNNLFQSLEYSNKSSAKRIQFFFKNYIDALSPTNFIHTNPQIIDATIKSHGKNLLKGLHNLLSDLESDSFRLSIKMTDTNAFKIGEQVAATPGIIIFKNEMMELIQYKPQTTKVKSIPLLIIPPWINKYYILDLSQHNSLIRWTVEQGISVFVISWVNPDASFASKGLYNYLQLGPLAAIAVIQTQLQVKKVNTLGFCLGGTLLALLLAYNNSHKDKSIHSATFLASMIDFSDPGDLSVFIDEQQIKQLEIHMKDKGYLSGTFMASSFNSLRANDLVWSFFIKNYLQGTNPVPFDILFWNADSTNMPATMHSQYLRWMYLHNNLIKPNKIILNKTPINIHQINIPTFFVSAEKDHIAPWRTTYKGFQAMKGPKEFVLGGSGHVAGIINPPSVNKYYYRLNPTKNINANEWFEHSIKHPGSWWPIWGQWLKKRSGIYIKSPDLTQLFYFSIAKAPGSYVLKRVKE